MSSQQYCFSLIMDINDIEDLRSNVESFMLSIELRNFHLLPEYGYRICAQLIELLKSSQQLEDDEEDEKKTPADDKIDQRLITIVDVVCSRIKEICSLARCYAEVLDFVRIRDLVCLSRMLTKTTGPLPLDVQLNEASFSLYRRTLNRSIALLRAGREEQDLMTNRRGQQEVISSFQVGKLYTGVGLPRYQLRLVEPHGPACCLADLETLLNSASIHEDHFLFRSKWFEEFLERTLMQPFPMDRFSLLVSLWILANDCKHSAACQLLSELVDQIYHEETNSNQEEELLQITQVGAFWLSFHRRGQPSSRIVPSEDGPTSPLDELDDDDDDDSEGQSSTHEVSPKLTRELDDTTLPTGSLELALRQLIQSQLIKQEACQLCGLRIEQPLGCLESRKACSGCGLRPVKTEPRCGLSLEKLDLLRLSSLLEPLQLNDERTLLLLGPGEWLRATLVAKANSGTDRKRKESAAGLQVRESIHLGDTFQRLTVIRDQSKRDTQSDDSSSMDSIDELNSPTGSQEQDEPEDPVATLVELLANGPLGANDSVGHKSSSGASESLRVLRNQMGASSSNTRGLLVPLLWLDVLFGHHDGQLIDEPLVRLTKGGDPLRGAGSLFYCGSKLSLMPNGLDGQKQNGGQLIVGCGQLFAKLELIRFGKLTEPFQCPYCGQPLGELRNFQSYITTATTD